jgi:hypothetical protein
MIFAIIGMAIVVWLMWFSYETFTKAPAKISQPVPAYDTQFDVFRDMEPNSQTRENPWVGFLQEPVYDGRTGPIGNFVGTDSRSGSATLYELQGGNIDASQAAPPALNAASIDANKAAASAQYASQQNINNQNLQQANIYGNNSSAGPPPT